MQCLGWTERPYLNGWSAGIISQVWLVGRVGQAGQPTNVRLRAGPLGIADGVPDARQPVSDQREGGHEEDKDGGTVFWVAVNLARHTNKAEETGGLQQTDQGRCLQYIIISLNLKKNLL